jgi:hypothetical protein
VPEPEVAERFGSLIQRKTEGGQRP